MDRFTQFNKWMFFVVCCLFTTLIFAGPKINANSNSSTRVLFVLLSKEATIHASPNKKDSYQLILNGVNSSVVYFADRPARFSKELALNKFLQQWYMGSFKNDPPNAIMHAVHLASNSKNGQAYSVSYAVVLKNPQYDKMNDRLIFDIQPLKGSPTLVPNEQSDFVALFIDDVCLSCL